MQKAPSADGLPCELETTGVCFSGDIISAALPLHPSGLAAARRSRVRTCLGGRPSLHFFKQGTKGVPALIQGGVLGARAIPHEQVGLHAGRLWAEDGRDGYEASRHLLLEWLLRAYAPQAYLWEGGYALEEIFVGHELFRLLLGCCVCHWA